MPRSRRGEAISLVCLVDLIDRSIRFSRFAARVAPREESLYARGGLPWARIRPSTASPHIGARRPPAGRGNARRPRASRRGASPRCFLRNARRRSATSCSPTGLPRSTIGARGLNFRVRDGTGCASPAMVADQRRAFSCQGRALRAAQRDFETIGFQDIGMCPRNRE